METVNSYEYWINVFDYKNLMLYLLDVTQNLSNKEIYYVDKLYRRYNTKNLYLEDYHKLNKSKLIKQAYEYEAQYLNQYVYIEYLDIYEEPNRDWKDFSNYDIIMNVDLLGVEKTAEYIKSVVNGDGAF